MYGYLSKNGFFWTGKGYSIQKAHSRDKQELLVKKTFSCNISGYTCAEEFSSLDKFAVLLGNHN